MKLKLLIFSLLLCVSSSLFALKDELPSWKSLESAQVQFECGNYGEALTLVNKAMKSRKTEINSEYTMLDMAVNSAQVRRAGNKFDDVLKVLSEREEKSAVSIIEKYLKLFGKDFFKNNIHEMLKWLKEKEVYPEAMFLSGKIYQLEGELDVAMDFYENAYKNRKYLDVPESKIEILYAMADVSKIQGKKEEMERFLLLILNEDDNFKNSLLTKSIMRTVTRNKKENVNRLYTLYRGKSKFSFVALYELCSLYKEAGRDEKSLELAVLATVESFTYIFDILSERDSRFVFTDLRNFFWECGKYDDVVLWGKENYIWKMFYMLADISKTSGYTEFADELLTVISESVPEEYYRKLAFNRLYQ